jgi:hypothetical protein
MSRLRPSPGLVVACIALIVALGGTGYAALKLPANSVGAKQLKKGAVVRAKIKNGAVDASKLAPNSVGGASINESALGIVPAASNATHAGAAAALDKITYKSADATIPVAPSSTEISFTTLDVNCDAGQHPLGAGIREGDLVNELILDAQVSPAGYEFRIANFDTAAAHSFTGTVTCITATAIG